MLIGSFDCYSLDLAKRAAPARRRRGARTRSGPWSYTRCSARPCARYARGSSTRTASSSQPARRPDPTRRVQRAVLRRESWTRRSGRAASAADL